MGKETLREIMDIKEVRYVRALILNTAEERKKARRLKKTYKDRIQFIFSSIDDISACKNLVKDASYVINMAAVIPPHSDKDPFSSFKCNNFGAATLVDAIKETAPRAKLIHISTVALYGNRNELHPFCRVGDPLIVSPFDAYAKDKLQGERYVLDNGPDFWVVLRQSAMLHPAIFKDNLSDGLMFHTTMNAPLEWVSSRDSGYLIRRIIERDLNNEIPSFWKKIYNIGSGQESRRTGYDTFNDGFAMIGGTTEKYFKPSWFASRNFHGAWFYDGDELEKLFSYQKDNVIDYWKEISSMHPYFSLARFIPPILLHFFLFRRLLHHPNSPQTWIRKRDEARCTAYFGSIEKALELPDSWQEVSLIARVDYEDLEEMKKSENARLLSLGWDETRQPENWTLDDLRQAAHFRGGRCLADTAPADPYEKVRWQCADGHVFESTPYTILKGGHWCPECCMPSPWQFDHVAKTSPFYAQIWYDSHARDENNVYFMDNQGKVRIEKWQ